MTDFASTTVSTPLGELTIVVSDPGVVRTTFSDDDTEPELERLEAQLGGAGRPAHVAGPRADRARGRRVLPRDGRAFATPVDLSLVPEGFRRRVLEATIAIPYGELVTYGDVAAAAGSRRAGRAAGGALSHCPIELFVPCHRVVHAGGTIGGYGRHEDRKRWLLRHEGAI